MENTPIRQIALAYNTIYTHLRMCSVNAPSSSIEIYNAIRDNPNIRNADQVRSYIKRMHKEGLVGRIREGLSYRYWLINPSEENQPLRPVRGVKYDAEKQADAPLKLLTENDERSNVTDVPTITISNSTIEITHSKYKLLLELT